MLHCNNVSRVFPIRSMHVRDVISDWCLIPVHDWVVCSSLAWFYLPILLAVCLFVLFSIRFSWRFDLCALMPYLSIVYYCAFWAVSIALRRNYVFWPLPAEFCLWFLGCIFCCTGFCVPVFMSHLDGLNSTGVSQVS